MASLWEIAIKNFKSPDRCPYQEKTIAEFCEKAGFLQLAITQTHIEQLRTLQVKEGHNPANYDPFDRMLLAQAKAEKLRFLTFDGNFEHYAESCILQM